MTALMKEQDLKVMCCWVELVKRAIVDLKEDDIVVPVNSHGPWQDTAEFEGLQEVTIGVKFLQLEDTPNIDITNAIHCQGHNTVEELARSLARFPEFPEKL